MANVIRALSMDAVQRANSGHPGMPMGMADVATVLFSKFLKIDPAAPAWPDRDRFIMSGGHGSMLQYALSHLVGYKAMTMDEIKNFRQLHAKTPGHPEIDHDIGVEMTTGPLGQGLATSIGFALAERILNARFGNALVDHHTYVMCGDGDLMEGISHEAASLAGHLKLSKLIVLYDDNNISIDGSTDLSFSENTLLRFQSYGWAVDTIDGHDFKQIEGAIEIAKSNNLPTLIACKTHIGFGSPNKQDTSSAHGSPLGDEEIAATKKALGIDYPAFEVPAEILQDWRDSMDKNKEAHAQWHARFEASPDQMTFVDTISNACLDNVSETIDDIKKQAANEPTKIATRKASGNVVDQLVDILPNLIGGSADLTGSVNTYKKGNPILSKDNYNGQYIHYGVREHGMACAMNGLALHGSFIPYAGTFLSFSDYSRPAIRLGALMKQRVIHVMTHDSIGLGEDGPTHQPVEHLASLRAMPNLYVFRPCDQTETAECWEMAVNIDDAPSILSLTRQGLEPQRTTYVEDNLSALGAYILDDCDGEPDITLFATGSEVEIAAAAKAELDAQGKKVRLVSCPCLELFWDQEGEYIQSLICNNSRKIAIEAGVRQGWDRIIGGHGTFIGMSGFGDSAPAPELYKYFGITIEAVIEAALK
ncbi:MAG: transketolase [Alphaproteobacteria bacterium]|nr:MAG: transketolase [Alphaproteobacteria bacterium]